VGADIALQVEGGTVLQEGADTVLQVVASKMVDKRVATLDQATADELATDNHKLTNQTTHK
jgi:hypothetical protein